jgi:thiol-disulfide isomerase/thioredoxin
MKKMISVFFVLFLFTLPMAAQMKPALQTGTWRASLIRKDGVPVVFTMQVTEVNKKKQLIIKNAEEEIILTNLVIKNDSVNFSTPFFESDFKTQLLPDGSLKGNWIKGTAEGKQYWPFYAYPNQPERFSIAEKKINNNISGRWAVTITRPNNTERPAIAEFTQTDNYLKGTFLTPSGDARYLEGVVTGDSLMLSAFDGSHIYFFSARISDNQTITDGIFYSGFAGKEKWIAVKNDGAQLPDVGNTPQLKESFERLDFTFPDINGKPVSINDKRFKDKVVIIQIMGSWCPNCMDETAFLTDYYKKNKQRGVEIISLAYELSNDFKRSQITLRKFQQRFKVTYPMLITGASVSDSLKTEKTLPQLTAIKVFPTTIFIGKDGKVKQFHTGFYGPGSGQHYIDFKKYFFESVDGLLNE